MGVAAVYKNIKDKRDGKAEQEQAQEEEKE